MSAVSSPVSCGEWPPKTVDQAGTLIGSPPAPLPWWRKPLPLPKLLVVPVVLQMATATQVRTMRFLWRLHRTFAESPELHDGLASADFSGVANRSQRDRQLALAWERHRQEPRPRSLLMLDLDHFKTCNDTGPCRAAATAGKGGGERLC